MTAFAARSYAGISSTTKSSGDVLMVPEARSHPDLVSHHVARDCGRSAAAR
jgi:hypothetical protein